MCAPCSSALPASRWCCSRPSSATSSGRLGRPDVGVIAAMAYLQVTALGRPASRPLSSSTSRSVASPPAAVAAPLTGRLHAAHGAGCGAAAGRRHPRDARAGRDHAGLRPGTTLVVASLQYRHRLVVPVRRALVRDPVTPLAIAGTAPIAGAGIAATRLRGTGPAADAATRVPSNPESDRTPMPQPLPARRCDSAARCARPSDLVLLDASFDLTSPPLASATGLPATCPARCSTPT